MIRLDIEQLERYASNHNPALIYRSCASNCTQVEVRFESGPFRFEADANGWAQVLSKLLQSYTDVPCFAAVEDLSSK